MQIKILEITVEITVGRAPPSYPFGWDRQKRRQVGGKIDANLECGNRKIARIKAIRILADKSGWNRDSGFGLKEAKFWVEETWADGGNGELL